MDILLLPPPESRQVAWWLVLNHKNCQACRRSMSELGLVSQGRAPGTRNHDVLSIANLFQNVQCAGQRYSARAFM